MWSILFFRVWKLVCFCFFLIFGRLQVGLRGAQEAPRGSQEALKRLQDPPKRAPRSPKSAPRGSKRPQEHPRRPQKQPKRAQEPVKRVKDPRRSTLKPPQHTRDLDQHYRQDNCAYQCCRHRRDRYKPKTLHPRRSSEWSGGRRCSPLGEAIRRPPRRGEGHGVSDP